MLIPKSGSNATRETPTAAGNSTLGGNGRIVSPLAVTNDKVRVVMMRNPSSSFASVLPPESSLRRSIAACTASIKYRQTVEE